MSFSVIVPVRLFGSVKYPQKTRARILIPARANWEKLKKRISVEWCSVCDNVMINFKKKQRFCAPHSPENLIKHFTQLQQQREGEKGHKKCLAKQKVKKAQDEYTNEIENFLEKM